MKILANINIENKNSLLSGDSVITIGKFECAHLGHAKLFKRTLELAREKKFLSCAVGFNMNLSALKTERSSLYTDFEQNLIIKEYGFDFFLRLEFNENLARMSPTLFVQKILRLCKARAVVVGQNFKFGYNREGNFELLSALCAERGVEAHGIKELMDGDEKISASRIRRALETGEIENANKLLGRLFSFVGKVIKGRQLGRTLGFPTANLLLPENKFIPSKGVYAARIVYKKNVFDGVVSVGVNPTISALTKTPKISVEAHIIDFNQNIYGEEISVFLVKFLREEKKFSDIEELRLNIELDVKRAQKILKEKYNT